MSVHVEDVRKRLAEHDRNFKLGREFIRELVEGNEELVTQIEANKNLVKSLRVMNLHIEQELNEKKVLIEKKERDLSKNGYVLVLIDGDGMIFKKELLAKGKEGGKETGFLLLDEIGKAYNEISPNETPEIHITIFANLHGLSTTLQKASHIERSEDFKQFSLGFTQAKEHLYFIDVGDGKEMADSRIKSEITWNLDNYNCRMVFLGASHDNGYARSLDSISSKGFKDKVLLLEGTPFVRELSRLQFKTKKFKNIFDSHKLEVPEPPAPKIQSSPKIQNVSYAATAVAGGKPTTPISTFVGLTTISAGRVTKKVMPDQDTIEMVKNLSPRACNDHYLRDGCRKQTCDYSHKYKLSAVQKEALRILAGAIRCDWGQDCNNLNCYRRHDEY